MGLTLDISRLEALVRRPFEQIANRFPLGAQDLQDGAVTSAKLDSTYKTAFPFGAGWADWGGGGGFEATTYSKVGRVVYLQGLVSKTGGAPASGNVIGTLPTGFRPTSKLVFSQLSGLAEQYSRIDIASNGDVIFQTGPAGETDYTTLSGIAFLVD